MDTIPIPSPPIIRYITNWLKPNDMAQPAAETVNNTAEISIVFFLPMRSLSVPPTLTPIIDPINAHPTYHPLCIVVNENCLVTCDTVPEITAVSYPNKNPPNAATTERNIT